MSDVAIPLRDLLTREIPRLYAFAFLMTSTREEARLQVAEIVKAATREQQTLRADDNASKTLLAMLARHFEKHYSRKSEHSFDSLDLILRSDITRPIDLKAVGLTDAPLEFHLIQWELKRTCLTAVLSCLPPGVRLSLLLTDVLEIDPDQAAEILGIKPSAYRVRLTRARKRVEDYLAPRCYHVDRANPCTCEGRLMIALDANFVESPEDRDDIPHDPHDADGPHRDVGNLYRRLPHARLTADELRELLPRQ